MSDIFIPGVSSRFDTDRIIEGLMAVERIPRDRAERQVETLQAEKGYWQEVGRRITSLRESSRNLFSFQNPFSERTAISSDTSILTSTATRAAVEQERSIIVKQVARADRFLSDTLDPSFRVEAGNYTFRIGQDEINLNYRGGSLNDFADMLNRRGRGRLQASVIMVERGRPALLIESLITGAENRLTFHGAAEDLANRIGIGGRAAEPPARDRLRRGGSRTPDSRRGWPAPHDGRAPLARKRPERRRRPTPIRAWQGQLAVQGASADAEPAFAQVGKRASPASFVTDPSRTRGLGLLTSPVQRPRWPGHALATRRGQQSYAHDRSLRNRCS